MPLITPFPIDRKVRLSDFLSKSSSKLTSFLWSVGVFPVRVTIGTATSSSDHGRWRPLHKRNLCRFRGRIRTDTWVTSAHFRDIYVGYECRGPRSSRGHSPIEGVRTDTDEYRPPRPVRHSSPGLNPPGRRTHSLVKTNSGSGNLRTDEKKPLIKLKFTNKFLHKDDGCPRFPGRGRKDGGERELGGEWESSLLYHLGSRPRSYVDLERKIRPMPGSVQDVPTPLNTPATCVWVLPVGETYRSRPLPVGRGGGRTR